MEAALTLAKREFNTVLFEEQDKLGGTANLAAIHPNEQHTPEVPLAAHASSPAQMSVGFPPSLMPTATSAARTTTWIAIAGTVPSTPKATL